MNYDETRFWKTFSSQELMTKDKDKKEAVGCIGCPNCWIYSSDGKCVMDLDSHWKQSRVKVMPVIMTKLTVAEVMELVNTCRD